MCFISSVFLSSAILLAADAVTPVKPKLTPAERKARREARIAADGGLVDRPIMGRVVRIKVETDKISVEDVRAEAERFMQLFRVAVEVVGKGQDPATKVGAYVSLVEQGEKVPTLLCAPEDYWTTVNVTRLLAGKPDAETLKSRIVKELWRGLGYALGAANSQQQPCVMRPIRYVGDLDVYKVAIVSPQPMMAMRSTMSQLGLAQGGKTTYRTACQEGWAAQPTNDVQKKVWEQVHTAPKEPMKIEFDPKKGR